MHDVVVAAAAESGPQISNRQNKPQELKLNIGAIEHSPPV